MSSPGIDRNYEHTNRRRAARNLKFDDRHDVTVRFGDFISLWSLAIIGPQKSHGLQPSLGPFGPLDTKTSACCHVPLLAKEPCKLCDHQPWATRYSSISICGESKKPPVNITQDGPKPPVFMNRGCANLNENWWTPPQSLVTVHWSGTDMIEKETIIWVWLSSIMILRTSKDPTMFLNFLHHCLKETEAMVNKPIVILNLMWLLCYAMAYELRGAGMPYVNYRAAHPGCFWASPQWMKQSFWLRGWKINQFWGAKKIVQKR